MPRLISRRPLPASFQSGQMGVTLVEVLITVLVFSVGLLGLAALQTLSLQLNHSSLMRSQATSFAYDLADRMRVNRQAALAGAYDGLAEFGPDPQCDANSTSDNTAGQDINEWLSALACALPAGNGRITRTDQTVTITVRWDDTRGGGSATEEFSVTTRL